MTPLFFLLLAACGDRPCPAANVRVDPDEPVDGLDASTAVDGLDGVAGNAEVAWQFGGFDAVSTLLLVTADGARRRNNATCVPACNRRNGNGAYVICGPDWLVLPAELDLAIGDRFEGTLVGEVAVGNTDPVSFSFDGAFTPEQVTQAFAPAELDLGGWTLQELSVRVRGDADGLSLVGFSTLSEGPDGTLREAGLGSSPTAF